MKPETHLFIEWREEMKKKCGILFLVLLLGSILPQTGTSNAGETRFMNFAAPPGSSNYYPYWVAVAKAIQNAHPEFRINVSESQGAVDIVRKIRAGMTPLGNSQSSSDYENYYGLGLFKGKPNKEARIMWYFDESPIQFIVLGEANIKEAKDLNKKKFNPGGTGTATALMTRQIFDTLGVKPNYFEAGQGSAADAVANRQIVGTVKTGNISGPDSFVMQIQANVPVDLLSFSPEEQALIAEQYPFMIPWTIKAGLYDWITHDTNTVKIAMGATTTTKLSQEDGYQMISAILAPEGRKLLDSAFPNGAKQNVIELTLQSKVPLHSGTVQYLHEQGVQVPEELIPPEYQRK